MAALEKLSGGRVEGIRIRREDHIGDSGPAQHENTDLNCLSAELLIGCNHIPPEQYSFYVATKEIRSIH